MYVRKVIAAVLLVGSLVYSAEFPANIQLIAVGGRVDTNSDATADVDVISISKHTHTKAAVMPTGLTGFGHTVENNTFYVVGGWSMSGDFSTAFLAFSVSANTWTSLPDFPLNILRPAVVAVDNVIYSMGGKVNAFFPTNYTYKYDMGAEIWWRITNPLPVSDVEVSCAVAYRSDIYLIYATGELYRSSDAAHSWTKLASMANGRYYSSCVALDNSGLILVAGGSAGSGEGDPSLNLVDMYDVTTDTWSTVPPMIRQRQLADAVVLTNPNNDVVICGGLDSSSKSIYDDCELFSQKENQWGKTAFCLNGPRFEYGLFANQIQTPKNSEENGW